MDPVIITTREIYDAVIKVSAQVAMLDVTLKEVTAVKADHEIRIRSLEKGRWPLPSISILIAVGALAVTVFTLIHH